MQAAGVVGNYRCAAAIGQNNGVRLHATLRYCSPNQYEQQHLEKP